MVCRHVQILADTHYFLSIYAENEQENLIDEQKRKLREFVAALG